MFQLNPFSVLALTAVLMCWVLGLVLYRVGAPGSVARKLALLMGIEGLTLISTGYIDILLPVSWHASEHFPTWVKFEEIVHTLGDCAMLGLYPAFLASALQTPLTRPFGQKRVRWLIWFFAAFLFFAVIFTPLRFGATLLYSMLSLLFAFALVASVQAWLHAKGAARNRARSFAFAFGIRDICWGFVYAAAVADIWFGDYRVVDTDASGALYVIYALGTLLAVPIIAYGILRTQLFDIDLKVRWTLKQSTLAAIFVTLIYLLSEGADRLLSAELGNFAGLLASAIVIYFLAPLQRFAEGVASLAMPKTKNTPEYAAYRKMQVYEAAVEEALQGGISDKERVLLNHLRDSLGISTVDAQTLEQDLVSASNDNK